MCYTHYLILLVFADFNSSTHPTLGKSRVGFDRMKECRVILLYTTTLHKPRKRNGKRTEIYKTVFGLIYLKSPFFILTVNRKCRVCRVCRVKRKKFLKKIQPQLLKIKSKRTLHPTLRTLPYTTTFFCKYCSQKPHCIHRFRFIYALHSFCLRFFAQLFLEILNQFSMLKLKF